MNKVMNILSLNMAEKINEDEKYLLEIYDKIQMLNDWIVELDMAKSNLANELRKVEKLICESQCTSSDLELNQIWHDLTFQTSLCEKYIGELYYAMFEVKRWSRFTNDEMKNI